MLLDWLPAVVLVIFAIWLSLRQGAKRRARAVAVRRGSGARHGRNRWRDGDDRHSDGAWLAGSSSDYSSSSSSGEFFEGGSSGGGGGGDSWGDSGDSGGSDSGSDSGGSDGGSSSD
jgi:hypothetical protein